MKKYISPKYAKEIIETKDVITMSMINDIPEITVDEDGMTNVNYRVNVNKLL